MLNKIMLYLLGIVLLLLSPDVATLAYGQTTVFGPEFYSREKGKPQKIVKRFFVQYMDQEFTLNVQNGEGKWGRVSSAVIELNGVQVIGPNEFNKQVAMITKPVKLKQQNEITIELRSEPGTSIVVTILGTLPSVTGIIPPEGGTVTLEGCASVTFPAGAFTAGQNVTVSATSFPETQEDFNVTAEGPRLPYEIRINSGYIASTTSFDVILNVPDSFIASIPSGYEIYVFAQMHEPLSAPEIYDHFHRFSSTFDSTTKILRVTLPQNAFTNLRHVEDTYEAILIVGAIPAL